MLLEVLVLRVPEIAFQNEGVLPVVAQGPWTIWRLVFYKLPLHQQDWTSLYAPNFWGTTHMSFVLDVYPTEIGWVSLLAVPWFTCIRRTSCHHIHSSKSIFFRFSKGWICGLDAYCHHWSFGFYCCYVRCSWWVMQLWQLFLMGHDWGSSMMLDVRFANHSAKSKCVHLWPLVSCLVVPTQTAASINEVTNFLVKGSYWNRFQISSQTSFQAFWQTKTFTSRLWTFVQQLD